MDYHRLFLEWLFHIGNQRFYQYKIYKTLIVNVNQEDKRLLIYINRP